MMAPRQLDVIRAGFIGGLAGGITIWIYEAIVWSWIQHLMPLSGIPRNAVGLVFGRQIQDGLGWLTYVLGTGIHFGFALLWGVIFAWAWPWFRRRSWEATLVAMAFAAVLWIIMHLAIALVSNDHPDYLDPVVVIGGMMSHMFYAVPLALIVKRRLQSATSNPGAPYDA